MRQTNKAGVLYLMVHERADGNADPSLLGICDPRLFELNSPVYDDDIQSAQQALQQAWLHNGPAVDLWSRESVASPYTLLGTTKVNIRDSSTAWSTVTHGANLVTQYRDTQQRDIPIEILVNAQRTAGGGKLFISLEQNGVTLASAALTGSSTGAGSSLTTTIAAQTSTKTDLVLSCSDVTTAYSVDSVAIWEYQNG